MGRCRETAGFLFEHPCSGVAEGSCSKCSKPICPEHRREGLCISCHRSGQTTPSETDPYTVSSFHYSDYPAVSHYDAYSQRDREAFNQESQAWDKDWDADFDGT